LEPFTLTIRSLPASSAKRISAFFSRLSPRRGLLLALIATFAALASSGCYQDLYKFPTNNFAGRPIPPSLLANRVLVGLTNGVSGVLQILDANRDLRMNIQNTILQFTISGYSGNNPTTILNFPDELKGYVYSNASPFPITIVNYGTEAAGSTAATLNSPSSSFATASDFIRLYSAQEETGQLLVADASTGATYALNLPNVYKVAVNQGDTIALAMVRNSNTLYRVVKLNTNSQNPPGYVDCEPTILPVYCVVPVPGTYDRPVGASFSLDGSQVYVLNCGQECGGGTNGGASVSFLPQGPLQINDVPTSLPYPPVVTSTVPIPGGVTAALSNGTTLYLAGQQLQPDGLYAGFLTALNLTTLVPSAPVSIADGNHSKLLFADNNTMWIAAQSCATGERQKLFAAGNTTQAANYNCLTRVVLPSGSTPLSASIIPAVNQAGGGATAVTVSYPNQNANQYYYGSLTGLCWVQGLGKVYTAYGGQIHAFHTVDGSEINNQFITVQGTALDVAYIDAQDDTSD
jgi:hypothetical protein